MKELIKYKGLSVAPAELEAVLLTHPAVPKTAVVRHRTGRPARCRKAYVVRRDAVSERELMDWVAGRAAPDKRVRLIEFTDLISKSPSGKFLAQAAGHARGGGRRNRRGTAMRTVPADVAGPLRR